MSAGLAEKRGGEMERVRKFFSALQFVIKK